MTILTSQDCRTVGLCVVPGQRDFCRAHGIDFRSFIKNGIDTAELVHIQDANLERAIAEAERREADGRR